MKAFSLIAHDVNYTMIELDSRRNYTRYHIFRELIAIGEIDLPSHLFPKFSVSRNGRVAIYAGSSICLINLATMIKYEEEEEVHRVWLFESEFLVESDTSLTKRLISDLSIKNQYQHDEIITAGLLGGQNLLYFEDLQDRVFSVDLKSFIVIPAAFPFKKLQ